MKTKIILAVLICIALAATVSAQTTGNYTLGTPYWNETDDIVGYVKSDKIYFYNVASKQIMPFSQEREPAFNLLFVHKPNTLYYTVERDSVLWLKEATFTSESVTINDVANFGMEKKECITATDYINSQLMFRRGKIFMKSNYVWDYFDFRRATYYSFEENAAYYTDDSEEQIKLFGYLWKEADRTPFQEKNNHLYYLNNGQPVNLTNKLNIKFEENGEGYTDMNISPDKSKVFFMALTSFVDLAHGPLCIADTDGKNQRILMDDALFDLKPRWIKDNRLLFVRSEKKSEDKNEDEKTSIYDITNLVLYITNAADNSLTKIDSNIDSFSIK